MLNKRITMNRHIILIVALLSGANIQAMGEKCISGR